MQLCSGHVWTWPAAWPRCNLTAPQIMFPATLLATMVTSGAGLQHGPNVTSTWPEHDLVSTGRVQTWPAGWPRLWSRVNMPRRCLVMFPGHVQHGQKRDQNVTIKPVGIYTAFLFKILSFHRFASVHRVLIEYQFYMFSVWKIIRFASINILLPSVNIAYPSVQ